MIALYSQNWEATGCECVMRSHAFVLHTSISILGRTRVFYSMRFKLFISFYLILIICSIQTSFLKTRPASRATSTLGGLCNTERSERCCIMRGSIFSRPTSLCLLFASEALYKGHFEGTDLLIDSYQESAPGKQVVHLLASLDKPPR